jgi:hypothetical protein
MTRFYFSDDALTGTVHDTASGDMEVRVSFQVHSVTRISGEAMRKADAGSAVDIVMQAAQKTARACVDEARKRLEFEPEIRP